jgi:DUF4097 and DUF4098 domain-containing protein YvlB
MRRGSVVGPLILIGIGVLFLLRNFYPNMPVLEVMAQYWPFILIGWGVLRIAEILSWAARSKPLPANGVSSGEWVLVVFLCLIGSGLYAARNSNWIGPGRIRIGGLEVFGEQFDYPLSAQQKVDKISKVTIESFRGNARITGADTDEIRITGRKTIRAMRQDEANRSDQETPLEIVVNEGRVIVRTNQDRASDHASRINQDLEITVPKNVSLEAYGRYGDFDIAGLAGDVEISSENAGVRIENIGGNVRVDTRRSDIVRAVRVKGSLELKGRGSDVELENIEGPVTIAATYSGTLQLRNLAKRVRFESRNTDFTAEGIPGSVRISLSELTGNHLIGPVRLKAQTKDVQITDFTEALNVEVQRGNVGIRPGKAPLTRLDIKTRSGDIDLALAENTKVQMSASTERGDITNDFSTDLQVRSEDRGATLKGSTGNGPQVQLATVRGSITVRKASAAEMSRVLEAPLDPPKPPKPPRNPEKLEEIEQ